MMTHGSLFSGIGGFDLAAEWMGWSNEFHCEINPFRQRVLKHHFPKAELFTDITKSSFKKYENKIDVLSGGFPCQPYSTAGKRLGKEDDRHLWPEMLRAVTEIQPRWVVGENVRGLLSWNGGLVFDEVQTDLENAGYEVWPFILPACGVNAPHRRDRIWFIAYNDCKTRKSVIERSTEECRQKREQIWSEFNTVGESGIITNTNSNERPERGLHSPRPEKTERHISPRDAFSNERNTWDKFPTQSPLCSRNDGLPSGLAGITLSKHRNESLKAYGNSIVPQVAHQIFKAIEQYELSL